MKMINSKWKRIRKDGTLEDIVIDLDENNPYLIGC